MSFPVRIPQGLRVLKFCVQRLSHYCQKEKPSTLTRVGISAARHIGLAISRSVSSEGCVGAFSMNARHATFFTTAVVAQISNPLVLNSSCITIDTSMETLLTSTDGEVQSQGTETILRMMSALAFDAQSIIFVGDECSCRVLAKRVLNILGDTEKENDHRFNGSPDRATIDLYFNDGKLTDLQFTKEHDGCLVGEPR